jgi:hypothetical protein
MNDCQFCGLPAESLAPVYGVEVCADCVELAELAFEPDHA